MKPLPFRFSETQKLSVDDLAGITKASSSDVARAALRIGLLEIKAAAARDIERGQDLVAIHSLRSK